MKKLQILSISLLLLFFSKNIYAQFLPIITPDKKWHIEYGNTLFPCYGANGEPCACYTGLGTQKVLDIKVFNEIEYYVFGNMYYIREEENRIFFYLEHCDREYLLYDFDLNVDDEVLLVDPIFQNDLYKPCELTEEDTLFYTYKVAIIDTIEYNQVKRKRLRLKPYWGAFYYTDWIEGIGCMDGFVYYTHSELVGGPVEQLKEVYEADELIFVNENPKYCFGNNNAINDVSQDLIKIFMDETNILHILNAENIPFTIYDLQGRIIQSVSPNSSNYQINISSLFKGLYIISNKEKNMNFKIVVK